VTVTELADTLAREHGLPFGVGHGVATRVIRASREQPGASVVDLIADATRELAGREVRLTDAEVARILSPEHFVAIRKTHGGPATDVVEAALRSSTALVERDRTTASQIREALVVSASKRATALNAL
jgi:argininosuccinate lyase